MTTEVSSIVATLVARMESNPEDFDYQGKFYHIQDGLYGLAGLREDKSFAYWFLNDTDKAALVAGWKQWHFKNFEKATYEVLFDDKFEERKREKEVQEQQMQAMKQQMYQKQMAMQNTPLTTISPLHNNAAQSGYQGLLGSVGTDISGIFK